MTLEDLEAVVKKHMLLADPHIIKLLCGFIVASRLPINPPWLFIVGPPSGGKTKLLEALLSVEGMVPIDNLTPKTFASGMRGKDGQSYSLLDNLMPNDTLLFADFTTFIQKDERQQGEIIGQMRRIYDGRFNNKTGNGVNVNWENRKISIIAGVTEEIYPALASFGTMGERFLLWEFLQADDYELAEMASHNLDDKPAKVEMEKAFAEFLNNFQIPAITTIDETTRKQIRDLSVFVCKARTGVRRKKYHRDNPIEQISKSEKPPRLVKQILGLGLGLQALNGGTMSDDDRHLLCKIALDSIPSMRRKCLQALTRYTNGVTTRGLAGMMNLPPETVRLHLQDLAAMELIKYSTISGHDQWRLHDEYRGLVEVYEGIRPIGDILAAKDEKEAIPDEFNLPPDELSSSYNSSSE